MKLYMGYSLHFPENQPGAVQLVLMEKNEYKFGPYMYTLSLWEEIRMSIWHAVVIWELCNALPCKLDCGCTPTVGKQIRYIYFRTVTPW